MTLIEDVMQEFHKTKFAREGGSCFECCDYEGMMEDLKSFICSAMARAVKSLDLKRDKIISVVGDYNDGWHDADDEWLTEQERLVKEIEGNV